MERKQKPSLDSIPTSLLELVDFSKYKPDEVYYFAECQGNQVSDLANESYFQALKAHIEGVKRAFSLSESLVASMTLQQLDKLASVCPKVKDEKVFIGSYFQKNFHEELSTEFQENLTAQEKRATLIRLY